MTRRKPAPRLVPLVTVSSTFKDLKSHRTALIKAIKAHGLAEVAMENDSAKLTDVIQSSLQMVQDGSAYIGIVSLRYGDPPRSAGRNPKKLSLTELEFDEAVRLDRPILLFVMGEKHRGKNEDFERDPARLRKLNAFRERAKIASAADGVHRVFAEFSSLNQFKEKIGPSIAELRRHLDAQAAPVPAIAGPHPARGEPIPTPPAFYAEPDYIVSNKFIGRAAQLQELSDWAKPADPHPVLLFDAIGGNGKSMLTWEWTNRHATKIRWSGRFWYSFYEKGAIMADFCQRALAYITGQPLEKLRRRKTRDLAKELLAELHANPWLIVLDGLERVLVAYHRIDAAEIPDEEANQPTDKIVDRDPCSAIRDDDDDLLRLLAAAAPSKILVTSRLMPRAFLNPAGSAIPGVRRISLPGLRPPDAELLLRSYGIKGKAEAIQNFLSLNCDCHPLVTGVLAGLINDYLPDKGNFDAWVADPAGGVQLNLASLDLIQRRNHILLSAIAALPQKSAELLGTLALIPESIDYPTLAALNPHLPAEIAKVEKPEPAESYWDWDDAAEDNKAAFRRRHEQQMAAWTAYEHAVQVRARSEALRTAPAMLTRIVGDLQRRGLLQYDERSKRYDMHPVVRAVAAGGLQESEKENYGQRVVDYFARQSHSPYESAENPEDVRHGLTVVRTLLKIGRFEQAMTAYRGDLSNALLFNLENYYEVLSLLRPIFPMGWGTLPSTLDGSDGAYLASSAGIALDSLGLHRDAQMAHDIALLCNLKAKKWTNLYTNLRNFGISLFNQNQIACAERIMSLALDLALAAGSDEKIFIGRLQFLGCYSVTGRWAEAEECWRLLDAMSRTWSRAAYRSGDAELEYARFSFRRGFLTNDILKSAESLVTKGQNRNGLRDLNVLRGEWLATRGDWAGASRSFKEAVRLARERDLFDPTAEAGLSLAKFHLGELVEPASELERLQQGKFYAPYYLARFCLATGDRDQAKEYARKNYTFAWADGEPYVYRYELTRAAALLGELGVPIPVLSPYDPAKITPFPWEADVVAAIIQLRAEKAEPEEE